ncbi:MAG TPA: hypothetical protein VJ872_17085 [Nocardioides sp.]|nr:hypothetical protein [Nocardioides sp.]
MATYSAYGLALASELALPDLDAAGSDEPDEPDVRVRLGPVTPPSADATMLPLGLWVDGERVGIDVPEVGRYSCEDGRLITVQADAGATDDALRLFLLGSALGIVLAQRGHLVLHGNAFRVGDACAVVLGHSGAGKSTLAAEMHRRGHPVLSDDVVPIDVDGNAIPGWARIKLWQDALDRLGRPSADLARVAPAHDKFHVPIEREVLEPLPVRWIYLLDRYDGPLRLTPITGAEVFACLHEHGYRNEVLVGALRRTHFARSATLAGRARFVRVERPRGVDSVVASADAILADVTSGSPGR